MKIKILLMTILITLFLNPLVSAKDLSGLNKFYNLDVFSNNSDLRIDIELTKDIKNISDPKLYKKSFEVILDKSYIIPAKRTFSVGDSLIDSVYVVQFSKDQVKVRFIFGDKVLLNDKDIKVETDSNKISIYVKRPIGKLVNANSDSVNTIKKEEHVVIKKGSESKIKSAAKPALKIKSDVNTKKNELEKTHKKVLKKIKNIDADDNSVLKVEDISDIKEPALDSEVLDTQDDIDENMAFFKDSKLNSFIKEEMALPNPSSKPVENDSTNLYYASFKMIGSLLLTLSIMFFIAFAFKKYSKNGVFGSDKPIKVLSTCYIGSKSSIALVDVLGEVLVVGITGSNISMLTKLTDEEKIKQIKNSSTGDIKKERFKKVKAPKEIKKQTNDDHGFDDYLDTVMKDDIVETQSKEKSIEKVASMIQEKLANIRNV